MTPKPDALRAFVAVAECGTLAAASERLNRTPSAISTTLKQLEGLFGGELFDGERKSQLTELGAFALSQSRRALADFDAATRSIAQFAAGRAGRVRVAAVPSVATRLLPGVVAEYQQHAPEVAFEIRDVDSLTVADLVREGQVDIGLASFARVGTDIHAEELLTEPFLVVCSATHPLAQANAPVGWHDLANERFIAHGLLGLIGREEVDVLVESAVLTVHNLASIMSFVESGLGITLLPEMAVPPNTSIATLPLDVDAVSRKVHLLTASQLSPCADEFATLIKQHVAARRFS